MTLSELIEQRRQAEAGLRSERSKFLFEMSYEIARLRSRIFRVGVICFLSGGVLAFSIALVFGV